MDGKTEKQAESECDLEINEENDLAVKRETLDEEDAVPLKRIKFSSNNLLPDQSKNDQISPSETIGQSHHNFKTDDNINQNSNIIEMVKTNVQSDVRTNISTKSTGTETKGSFYGGPSSKCPLNFSVGQEVMGQCPYSTDNSQIIFESSNPCDIESNIGCPFKHEESLSTCTDILKSPVYNKSERDSDTFNENERENLNSVKVVEPLFCGIYPHRRWPLKIFEVCEQLGKNLANKLIEKGAISIMERAQNEIRSSI